MSKTSIIVLGGTGNLEITRNPAISNVAELIPKDQISGVFGEFNIEPSTGELVYESQSGPFQIGETITGGTSGATAIIQEFKGTTTMILSSLVGEFLDAEVITGGTSLATANTVGASTSTSYPGEWIYPYPTMTVLQIQITDGSRLNIELQDVSNQATWNGGDLADLQAAIAAINAWL